jgi:hypothetical protein
MKKFIYIFIAAIAILSLSGCTTSWDDDYDEIKYHVVDQNGHGVSDIRYTCNGHSIEKTDGSGGLYFYSRDDCTLELELSVVNSTVDTLYMENDDGVGVRNIPYECESGLFGRTDINGNFKFDNINETDFCTFRL